MKQLTKVLYASDDAAQMVTVKGWKSRSNHFYGDNEHLARWDGCTHLVCACGAEMERGYAICGDCSAKKRLEQYEGMPLKEWDGETLLTLHDDDKYFRDKAEIDDYCETEELRIEELRLVICEPEYAWEITPDYYYDILPEGMELDDCYSELAAAIQSVNKLIRRKEKPISWSSGRFRTALSNSKTHEDL